MLAVEAETRLLPAITSRSFQPLRLIPGRLILQHIVKPSKSGAAMQSMSENVMRPSCARWCSGEATARSIGCASAAV